MVYLYRMFTVKNTPAARPWYRRPSRLAFIAGASVLALALLVFLGYLLFFLWQFRFGNPSSLEKTAQNYRGARFSLGVADGRQAAQSVENPARFVRPHNPAIGPADAPITIIAFIDFECPFSQESYAITRQVVAEFDPAVRMIFKHLPLPAIHPNAYPSAVAATCAQEQGFFWEYYDALFISKRLDKNSLEKTALELGMSANRFSSCMQTERYRGNIQQDMLDAVDVGARGTPTYIVNGKVVEGVISAQEWQTLILELLKI